MSPTRRSVLGMAKSQALTVNETILDRTILHDLRLQHVNNGTARRVRDLLWAAHEDTMDQLSGRLVRAAAKGFDTGPVTTKRLRELSAAYRRMAEGLMPDVRRLIAKEMVDVSIDEVSWQSKLFDDTLPVKYETLLPGTDLLRTLALKTPFSGKVLSEWTQQLGRQTLARFNQAVKLGLVNGETVDQVARRIRGLRKNGFRDGVLGWQRYEAQTLARTAMSHAQSQAREAMLEANSRLLKGWKWSAALDTKTCVACANLDGKLFHKGENRPQIPLHFGCRCSWVGVTKSFRDIGIDIDDVPKGHRWTMNGDVPADTTYGKWIGTQTRGTQLEALGRGRFDRFKAGEPIGSFVNRQNRILTIKELKAREGR